MCQRVHSFKLYCPFYNHESSNGPLKINIVSFKCIANTFTFANTVIFILKHNHFVLGMFIINQDELYYLKYSINLPLAKIELLQNTVAYMTYQNYLKIAFVFLISWTLFE